MTQKNLLYLEDANKITDNDPVVIVKLKPS